MNILVRLSVLCLMALSIPALPAMADSKKKVKVILLGGQSNMVGTGKAANLEEPFKAPHKSVTIWQHKTKSWVPLSPESVNSKGRFGPEILFGHTIATKMPEEEIRLIKYAAGGTSLYRNWSPIGKGPQYVRFMETATSALKDMNEAKVDYEITAMLWLQGESDAKAGKGESYEQNMNNFIAHMREQFKTPDMPFIIARVRSHYGKENGHAKIVRDAQVKVGEDDKRCAWFDTDDLSMMNAGHYDAAGLTVIGQRFAEKYLELTK